MFFSLEVEGLGVERVFEFNFMKSLEVFPACFELSFSVFTTKAQSDYIQSLWNPIIPSFNLETFSEILSKS